MKNKANLPFLIFIGLFLLGFISVFLIMGKDDISFLEPFFSIYLLCFFTGVIVGFIACPIGLVFQIKNKNKSKLDRWFLGLNAAVVLALYCSLIFLLLTFPNLFQGEKQVRKQIQQEQSVLDKEYQPVLNYLDTYKKEHGVYPENIDNVAKISKTFDKYEYKLRDNKKGYWLQVYPTKGPIEYYYNDKDDSGYRYYVGDGYIDGFMDNDNYYQVNNNWHAVMFDYFTRHSKVFGEARSEKAVDEWMKNNVEKF